MGASAAAGPERDCAAGIRLAASASGRPRTAGWLFGVVCLVVSVEAGCVGERG
jgi:hypothetical protein